jgi:putative ABC transport system permease protein
VKPSNALRLYRVRLRARWVQESLAVVGIAAGVALLFASQVSSSSLQSSVAQLSRGIAGNATLQLLARDPQGFPEGTLRLVRRIPGVRVAAPLLEVGANAIGPRGSEPVELVGADSSLSELGGTLVRHTALAPFGGVGAIVLPAPLARAIGVSDFGQEATFELAGHTARAPLYAQLHERQIGPLIGSPIAIAPLSFAQQMTGLRARVSRILVQPAAGSEARVRAALVSLAGGRLDVEPIGYSEALFAKLAAASSESTALFAAICALVGFLFAFNAMLLTVPQRRRLIADLRREGYTPGTVVAVLLLDALALGVLACALGLALGEELSIHLLHSNPAFLSLAFALGAERVVSWQSVAVAAGGGMLAAIVAVLSPLRDILSRDPLAAIVPREASGVDRGSLDLAPAHRADHADHGRPAHTADHIHHNRPARFAGPARLARLAGPARLARLPGPARLARLPGPARLARLPGPARLARLPGPARLARPAARPLAGLVALGAATAILLAAPGAAIPGMVLLVGALLLELPVALSATLALVTRLARAITSVVPHIAVMELRAARARAVAIAATGAVAVFGSVAIQGAHGDLLAGLEDTARDMNASTDVWVSPAGSYNLLQTAPFEPTQQARLARLPGVRAVRVYRSGLLDYGERSVLVIAPPRQATPLLPADQLVQGSLRLATARVRAGGWLVLSRAIATEHHLRIGQAFTLPAPDPRRFRLAALSTNMSWAGGAIIMNASDYARAWGSSDASAYGILLAPGVSPTAGRAEIERALGPPTKSGLAVETAQRHAGRQLALSRQALARLTQIATLIPIAAVLAMAAAMGALVWQRRPRLAKLKLEGLPRAELWRTILLESLLLVGVGCLLGAIFGLYGQQLTDRLLSDVVDFPVVYSVTALGGLESLALVTATALAILAIPGYLAACVPAALALQD